MGRKDSISSGDLTDTHYYILLSLMTSMHGYAVMQKVEDLTEGHVVMGPGSVYTMIQKLLKAGYIKPSEQAAEQRKSYVITNQGIDIFQKELKRRKKMVEHGENALQMKGEELS